MKKIINFVVLGSYTERQRNVILDFLYLHHSDQEIKVEFNIHIKTIEECRSLSITNHAAAEVGESVTTEFITSSVKKIYSELKKLEWIHKSTQYIFSKHNKFRKKITVEPKEPKIIKISTQKKRDVQAKPNSVFNCARFPGQKYQRVG